MRAKASVILNPRARHGKVGRKLSALEDTFRRELGGRYNLVFLPTESPGHATELCRDALRQGAELIVAVGGDGTFHEVVNGFRLAEKLDGKVPLALLSRGTGGDTRRTLGLPTEPMAFCRMVLSGKTRRVDLGLAEFRDAAGAEVVHGYLNIGEFGIGGDVVAQVNKGSKRFGGFLSFLSAALIALVRYRPKEVDIRIDGGPKERRTLLFLAAANCRYFGGGMLVAPRADPGDGLLDAVIVDYQGFWKLIVNLPRIYRGTHLTLPNVEFRKVTRVEATPVDGPVLLDLDGEQPGLLPVVFRILPGALRICVPTGE